MRLIVMLSLGGALAVSACGSSDSSGSGSGRSGGSAAPTITMVAWETTPGCERGTGSEYTVTVTASTIWE